MDEAWIKELNQMQKVGFTNSLMKMLAFCLNSPKTNTRQLYRAERQEKSMTKTNSKSVSS